jgi:SSS family solute:Na+ symporter
MPKFSLQNIDWFIIILYFVFIIWRGFKYLRTQDNAETYFLAGRKLTWPLIGLSLFASNMSSSSLVGLSGSGFQTGVSVFSYEWIASVVLIMLAVFFLPFYLRSKIYTMPEFLEKRYDARVRYYFSGLSVLMNIGIDTAATLYAGALVIQLIFPSIELWQSILALAILSGLYTIAGGLTAVVYTDAIQAVLLVFGSIIITITAFFKIGSWDALIAVTPAENFSIIQPVDDTFLPWPGLFSGVFLLGFYFWATNQFIVQRALGAKSIRHGQWGSVFAGFLKLTTLFIMIFPGMFARVLYPDLEKANLVYPTLLFDLLPAGILGLVLSGLIAAMMSSIDSALNSASTLITMDFYKKIRPRTSAESLMWIGRVITFVFMILAAVWAPHIDEFPTLWEYLQAALSYICPPIVSVFIMGLFWKRSNGHGAFAAVIVGSILTIYFILQPELGIHYLYIAMILFVICNLTIILVSHLSTPPTDEQVRAYTWSIQLYMEETKFLKKFPIYTNYRFWAVILMLCISIILAIYW